MRESNYLFSTADLSSALEAQGKKATSAVASMQKDHFLSTTVDTLVEHLIAEYVVVPLSLDEQGISMDHAEAKVNVTGDFRYGGYHDGRPMHVDGHTLKFYIPFTGNSELWRLRPSTWSTSPPSADIDIPASRLVIAFTNTSNTESDW